MQHKHQSTPTFRLQHGTDALRARLNCGINSLDIIAHELPQLMLELQQPTEIYITSGKQSYFSYHKNKLEIHRTPLSYPCMYLLVDRRDYKQQGVYRARFRAFFKKNNNNKKGTSRKEY